MGLVTISSKVPEDLFEELQRESAAKQVSVSQLLRQKPTRKAGNNSPGVFALTARIKELERQVNVLATAVERLSSLREDDPPVAEMMNALSENIIRLDQSPEVKSNLSDSAANFPSRDHIRVRPCFILGRETCSRSRTIPDAEHSSAKKSRNDQQNKKPAFKKSARL